MRAANTLLSLAIAVSVAVACPNPAGGAEGEEAPDPRIEQLRSRMEELLNENARVLIATQQTKEERADTAMIMGTFIAFGVIGDANPVVAFEFYNLASELGSPEADCALGALFATGAESPTGSIPRDPQRALSCFEKAANAGSVKAMLELGDIYAEGKNTDPDPKRALGYYMEAAKRGDADALRHLEPVMRNAREWEAERPGRKANFPTSREEIVDPALERENGNRNAVLDRKASKLYVELNKRIAADADASVR